MREGKRLEKRGPSCLDTLAGQTTLRAAARASLLQERPLLVTGAAAGGGRGWRRGLRDGRPVLRKNVDPAAQSTAEGAQGDRPSPLTLNMATMKLKRGSNLLKGSQRASGTLVSQSSHLTLQSPPSSSLPLLTRIPEPRGLLPPRPALHPARILPLLFRPYYR